LKLEQSYLRSVRLVSSLIVLLAVLIMPFGMPAAAHVSPQNRAEVGMAMSHCPDQDTRHDGKGAIAECAMACSAALPASPQSMHPAQLLIACDPARPQLAPRLTDLHPETATPPPKHS
jgi:hypothetical protein